MGGLGLREDGEVGLRFFKVGDPPPGSPTPRGCFFLFFLAEFFLTPIFFGSPGTPDLSWVCPGRTLPTGLKQKPGWTILISGRPCG